MFVSFSFFFMTNNLLQLEAENLFQDDYNINESDISSTLNQTHENILKTTELLLDNLINKFNEHSHIDLNYQNIPKTKINMINELNITLSKEMKNDRGPLSRTISYQRSQLKPLSPRAASQLDLFTLSELESTCTYNLNILPYPGQDLTPDLNLYQTIKDTKVTNKNEKYLLNIPSSTEFYVFGNDSKPDNPK